jgi:hypothetical protein
MADHGWLTLPRLEVEPIPIERACVRHYAIDCLYQATVELYYPLVTPTAWLGQPARLQLIDETKQSMYLHGLLQQINIQSTDKPPLIHLTLVTPLHVLHHTRHAVWGKRSYHQWLSDCTHVCPSLSLILRIPSHDTFEFLALHNENYLTFILDQIARQGYNHTWRQTSATAQWIISDTRLSDSPPDTLLPNAVEIHHHNSHLALVIDTNAVNLFPGQWVTLAPHRAISDRLAQQHWQVHRLTIDYRRGHFHALQVTVELTNQPTQAVKSLSPIPSPVLEALVSDTGKPHADLDDAGRYALFFPYTRQTIDNPRFTLAQPYSDAGGGFHSPLTPNSRVLVAFLEDDRQRPFILGALADRHHPSSVTVDNALTHCWQSIAGHRLLVDNDPAQPSMTLSTASGRIQLCLRDVCYRPGIYGTARQGDFIMQTDQNCQWNSQHKLYWEAKHNLQFSMSQNLRMKSDDLLFINTRQHLQMRAEECLSFKTKSLDISAHHLYWQADKTLAVEGEKELRLSADSMTWQAGDTILCEAFRDIDIQHGAGRIQLSLMGRITLTAPVIHIHGKLD